MQVFYTLGAKVVNGAKWPPSGHGIGAILLLAAHCLHAIVANTPPPPLGATLAVPPAFTFQAYLGLFKPQSPPSSAAPPLPPYCRWSSISHPGNHWKLRLLVKHSRPHAKTLGGSLLWELAAASPNNARRHAQIIHQFHIAPTRMQARSTVELNLNLPTPRVGDYMLKWRDGKQRRTIFTLPCIYPPTGLRTPADRSLWIAQMPACPAGLPSPYFASNVQRLAAITGIKKYWLTLCTGDPINRRTRLFAATIRAAGGELLLRVIYPIAAGNAANLTYRATHHWLNAALVDLHRPAAVEIIFSAAPRPHAWKQAVIAGIFRSAVSILRPRHIRLLIPQSQMIDIPTALRKYIDGQVIAEDTAPHVAAGPANTFSGVRWALPPSNTPLRNNTPAAMALCSGTTVVGVCSPWHSPDSGWLIHLLGAGIWLENQRIRHWGTASIFQTGRDCTAIVRRRKTAPPKLIPGVKINTRWVSGNLARVKWPPAGAIRPKSFLQLMDPNGAITVLNQTGLTIPPHYPGLPRVPARLPFAFVHSTRSASSLLAALRTASPHLQPQIIAVGYRIKPSAIASRGKLKSPDPVRSRNDRSARTLLITIGDCSAATKDIRVSAMDADGNRRVLKPGIASVRPSLIVISIHERPRHPLARILIAVRESRRVWGAEIRMPHGRKPQ